MSSSQKYLASKWVDELKSMVGIMLFCAGECAACFTCLAPHCVCVLPLLPRLIQFRLSCNV